MTSAGVSSRVGAAAGHTPYTVHWPYTLGRQPVPNINIAVVLHGFVFCEFTGTQMISVCNASVFWGDDITITLAYHMFTVKVQKQKFHSEINRDRRAGEQLHTGDRVSYLYADRGRVPV